MPVFREAQELGQADHPVVGVAVLLRDGVDRLVEVLVLIPREGLGQVPVALDEAGEGAPRVSKHEPPLVEEERVERVLPAEEQRHVADRGAVRETDVSQVAHDVE